MSYRMCDSCENITTNICWNNDYCPNCSSTKWRSPVDDDRDWDKLYKEQEHQFWKELGKIMKDTYGPTVDKLLENKE